MIDQAAIIEFERLLKDYGNGCARTVHPCLTISTNDFQAREKAVIDAYANALAAGPAIKPLETDEAVFWNEVKNAMTDRAAIIEECAKVAEEWADNSVPARIRALAAVPPAPTSKETTMNDAQITHMLDRFLAWRLPKDFRPDNGISYKRPNYSPDVDATPTGTNLFDAEQARAMIRHMVEGMSVPPIPEREKVLEALKEAKSMLAGGTDYSWTEEQHVIAKLEVAIAALERK